MNTQLKVPAHVLHEQYSSSNPKTSAWVSANAGSGKTHVLTQRVIRLMLAGNAPSRILCLTFTKAAAANMKSRVFDTLAKWTMMEDIELEASIQNLTGERANQKMLIRARQLFALALDAPGGLKIQTIHAYCEALLHQFPLEANVPGHFQVLQDIGQVTLLREAKASVLAGKSISPLLKEHFLQLLKLQPLNAIEQGLSSIVQMRSVFIDWLAPGIENALEPLYSALELNLEDTENSIKKNCIDHLPVSPELLIAISEAAGSSDKDRDKDVHRCLQRLVHSPNTSEQFIALEELCFTKSGKTRSPKSIVTKYVKDRIPGASDYLTDCGQSMLAAKNKLNGLQLITCSRHLYHIAEAVIERYASLKRQRGVVDFDDLVDKSASLLNRHDISEWIRYRLDRGIDHVLVDEAQDTSPKQWEIINAITADFHSGETASNHDRTMFVVGDEKQSIYSFQGARPDEFAKQQDALRKSITNAQKQFHPGKLSLSFRSTKDVLHAVDLVFSSEANRKGLMQSGETPVHDAIRVNDPGEVQVWPVYVKEKGEAVTSWLDPVDRTARSDPAVQLATRIAQTIENWVGKPLPGSNEPLKYKDVLVLVRKRDRFIPALTRIMKDCGLQVAGADRLVLTDHIAIEDVLALAQFAVLPQDNLNLACALKGALFNFNEDTLFDLTYNRGALSLFESIARAAEDPLHPHYQLAKATITKLTAVIGKAKTVSVFDFFAWLMGPFGLRQALIARLGMEAEDVLDAFLDETISFTREGGIGLEKFISSIVQAQPEIKREVELERDEVRILTVHASKGLEAKVVFLVDPGNPPWNEKHRPPILSLKSNGKLHHLWLPSSALHVTATKQCTDQLKMLAQEEYHRLLYVGMTRAADRLVMCGYQGSNTANYDTWHTMVQDALRETSSELLDDTGNAIGLRWVVGDTPVTDPGNTSNPPGPESIEYERLPDWLTTPVMKEPPLPSPLTPTGAHALIGDEEIAVLPKPSQNSTGIAFATQKGKAAHRLLETLPEFPVSDRQTIGGHYLERVGTNWSANQRELVLSEVMSILESPEFAHLFTAGSSAEVALTGKLKTKSGDRLIAGQIDRLLVTEKQVSIIDYKSNQSPPGNTKQIPLQYLTQMSLYRELVSQIYPDHETLCYLLWIHGPELMPIPDNLLDNTLESIKNT